MGKSAKAHKRVSKQERLSKKQQAEAVAGPKERSTPKGGVPKQVPAPAAKSKVDVKDKAKHALAKAIGRTKNKGTAKVAKADTMED